MAHLSEMLTLDRDECLRLLRTVTVGRIVYTEGALPAIQRMITSPSMAVK
ncbi:MAG: pyridoxamine 5'-phosphate oxidase family protein [Actinomycetota bacterium]|nr:pyridoxamine 5'-phosphate oxidase family protein [Actinomycetota bacterium]